jgi:AmiR/NasT family two-component response regulator
METTKGHLNEFKKLNFLLVLPRDDDSNHIGDLLRQLGCQFRIFWPVPMPLPSEGDILICEYSPEIADCTPWLPGDSPLPFILHIPRNLPVDYAKIRNCAPHGLLHSPGTETSLVSSTLLAQDQFKYEHRLRLRIHRLDENLRSMRLVEKAKRILMNAKKIGEEEAYSVLRRTAMERRITLGSIATSIVESHELLVE